MCSRPEIFAEDIFEELTCANLVQFREIKYREIKLKLAMRENMFAKFKLN